MEYKRCKHCGELKPISEFYKHKSRKDGLLDECKVCKNEYDKQYRRTKKGLVSAIYSHQRRSSEKRGHPMPTYTNKELKEWLYSQKKFHELYDNWKSSGFNKWLKPSVDRIDDYKPYTLDNIQIVTWRDNAYRYYEDKKRGANNKQNKAVLQFSLDGGFIAEYYSISEADRRTGISFKSISNACIGRYKTAGGYKWMFKDEARRLD